MYLNCFEKLQSWTKVFGTVLQYAYLFVISRFPLKTVHHFRIFLHFSLPLPYTKLKLGKNSGYTRKALFVGWAEGLDLCELENAPETQKCPKTFVHDCSFNKGPFFDASVFCHFDQW